MKVLDFLFGKSVLIIQDHTYTPLILAGPQVRVQIFPSRKLKAVYAKLKDLGFTCKKDRAGQDFWLSERGLGATAVVFPMSNSFGLGKTSLEIDI